MNEPSLDYTEVLDDLRRCVLTPATAAKAVRAIKELLQIHQLDQAEIMRMRRQMGLKEEEKWEDLREGNRSPYRSGS